MGHQWDEVPASRFDPSLCARCLPERDDAWRGG
jgi:hypothetical protein